MELYLVLNRRYGTVDGAEAVYMVLRLHYRMLLCNTLWLLYGALHRTDFKSKHWSSDHSDSPKSEFIRIKQSVVSFISFNSFIQCKFWLLLKNGIHFLGQFQTTCTTYWICLPSVCILLKIWHQMRIIVLSVWSAVQGPLYFPLANPVWMFSKYPA